MTESSTSSVSEGSAPESLAKAERLFRLAALLREGQLTVRELALRLYPTALVGAKGWSGIERAIQRDLADLERLEPEYQPPRGRPPRYSIQTHRTQLHPVEVLALHSAARMTYHRAPGQRLHHQAALKKLTQWLPERVQSVVARSFTDLGRRRGREDLNLELAAQAWLDGHPLRFEYRKPGGSGVWRTNIVETYLIETHPGNLDLYVVGRETSYHQDVRTFKLSRMQRLHVMTEQSYQIPDSFEPQDFFHAAWGVMGASAGQLETIRLRFSADAAYRIMEGGYAHLSEPDVNTDGSIDTSVTAPVDPVIGFPREVLGWVLSFGPRVQVLGPPHLRAHWQKELRAALTVAEQEEGE
ncbi:helix-turn-helix transcriptional regulator [Deinococcus sp.]|uniref:helix-turn-helix transcriptional regulator n=1 Tax=Deinococcus sp. TaxID=47478 RepID=UPI003C7A2F99